MVDGDLYATYGVEGDPSVAAEQLDLYSSTHRPASCDQAQSPFGGTKPNFFKKNNKKKTFVVFSVVALGNYISIQWMLIDTEMLPKPIIAGQPQSSQKTRGKKAVTQICTKQTGSHLFATGSILKANNGIIITEREKY